MVEAEWSGEEAQKRVEEAQQNEKEEVEEAQQNEKEEVEVAQQNEEETTENSLAWATTAPSTDSTPASAAMATLSIHFPLKTRTTVSQASQEEAGEEDTRQWQTFPSSLQIPPVIEKA